MASREELEERERVRSYLFDTGREGTRLGMGNSVSRDPRIEQYRSSPEYISRNLSPDKLLETRLRNYEQLKLQYVNSSSIEERREVQNALQRVGDEINQLSQNVDVGGYTQQRSNLPDISSFNADNSTQAPLFETDNTSILSSLGLAQTSNDDTPPLKADAVTAKSSTPTLGASNTNLDDLSAGALKALGGAESVQAALEIAKAMQPKLRDVDPALLAFQFFTNMAAESSKPGATALGAASTASLVPAEYLMQDFQARRKAESELPANVIQIAGMIKPPTGTGTGLRVVKGEPVLNEQGLSVRTAEGAPMYNYNEQDAAGNVTRTFTAPDITSSRKPITVYKEGERQGRRVIEGTPEFEDAVKDGYTLTDRPDKPETGIKTAGSGTLAQYMSAENAREFVKNQGMLETHPNFQASVDKFTAPNDKMIGQEIVRGGAYLEAVPLQQGGEVINIQLTPSKGAGTPQFTTYVEKRLPFIAKAVDTYNTTAREVIPRINEAMDLLLSGKVETGGLSAAMLPFKRVFNQAFGINDPAIIGLESLQATSNFLAPKMRPVGSGSTSDMEFKAYRQAALDIGNTPQSNYISLYAFRKMAENGVALNQREQELLTSGEYSNMADINKELMDFDPGIFEKFSGDYDDPEAINAWYAELPRGAVILNNNLFESPDIYIIKGWGQ
jgi:hypothetical protein